MDTKRSYWFGTAWGGVQVYRNGENLYQESLIICSEQCSLHRFSWLGGLTWWWWRNWGGFFFTEWVNLLSQGDILTQPMWLGSDKKFSTANIRCLRGWQIKHGPIHQDLLPKKWPWRASLSCIWVSGSTATNLQWARALLSNMRRYWVKTIPTAMFKCYSFKTTFKNNKQRVQNH